MSRTALEKLRSLAAKRDRGAPSGGLSEYVRGELPTGLRVDAPLLPWDMTVGHGCAGYEELGEGERLALNHWTWFLLYKRIADGEVFVERANRAIAAALRDHAPDVAGLLERESAEERDHMTSFRHVGQAILAQQGLAALRLREKPLRAISVHPAVIRGLLRLFGADFLVGYYLGRGLANHLGKAFETQVSRLEGPNRAIHRLSLLHTQDESQHMAVSHLLSACAHELWPHAGRLQRSAPYATARQAMHTALVYYTFNQRFTRERERRHTVQALRANPAFRRHPDGLLRELVAGHFALDRPNGVDRCQNRAMGAQNARLLDGASLTPELRALWGRLLTAHQGPLLFLPAA